MPAPGRTGSFRPSWANAGTAAPRRLARRRAASGRTFFSVRAVGPSVLKRPGGCRGRTALFGSPGGPGVALKHLLHQRHGKRPLPREGMAVEALEKAVQAAKVP